MGLKLVISEKPSVGKAYADVLGAKTKKDGYYEGNGFVVSWCVGHLLGLAEPQEYDIKYAKWCKEDLPISPDTWKYVASQSTKKQLKVLVDLMKRSDVDLIINGADAGREGELIFRLVYEHAKSKKSVKRLWVSSMEELALKDGFNNLRFGSDYDKLFQAAQCRQQADWLVGMNFSRIFSIIYNAALRVGRVQTPTLAMVVERFEKIINFVKEPFYVVELTGADFTAERERLTEKALADEIAAKCNGQTAVIRSVKKQDKSIAPPRLYDLTTLQREANKMLGLTASKTLEIVQALYERKIVTYPRTDSKFITDDMAHSMDSLVAMSGILLAEASGDKTFAKEFTLNVPIIVNNSKVTDHHAILPTMQAGSVKLNSLSEDERSILLMICAKLICAVHEKHTYAETVVMVECCDETFTAKGKTVTNNGWKQVEDDFTKILGKNKKDDNDGAALPTDLSEGQQFTAKTSVREGFTSPPKYYTEDTLLSAMENAGVEGVEEEIERRGLGTPATRAGIIENLVKSELLKRDKKNLLPTDKGINLIKVLPDKVKSPLLTADWENALKRMERGEVTVQDFMKSINDFVGEVVCTYGNTPSENKNPFGTAGGSGEVIGVCPRCGGNVIESPKAFSCEHTRSKKCGFALWKDNKFFASQGKTITKNIAEQLINNGQVFIPDLKSQKTGKKYGATILLDDGKDGYVNFKMEFNKNR
jgi:DNA topoisomerase-3